jgi:hypothetical protein
MTIPTQMNCPHMDTGWCLDCVGRLHEERQEKARAYLHWMSVAAQAMADSEKLRAQVLKRGVMMDGAADMIETLTDDRARQMASADFWREECGDAQALAGDLGSALRVLHDAHDNEDAKVLAAAMHNAHNALVRFDQAKNGEKVRWPA